MFVLINAIIPPGMDVQLGRAGGTWMGMSPNGRIGCLLNIFQPAEQVLQMANQTAGRGFLVVDYLRGESDARTYLDNIKASNVVYNQFNLVTLEMRSNGKFDAFHYDNVCHEIQEIHDGISGFGNCIRGSPFLKVQRGKEKLKGLVDTLGLEVGTTESQLLEGIWKMMRDDTKTFPDPVMNKQGQGYDDKFLQELSSVFVCNDIVNYGTRTISVILVDFENRVRFIEQTMKEPIVIHNVQWMTNDYSFVLESMV